MAIHIVRTQATPQVVRDMLEAHITFIKLAVDVRRRLVAGGGNMHADCEAALLEDGSAQDDVWGADWYPDERAVEFDSFINIRPGLGNPSMRVMDEHLRSVIEGIVREQLEFR